MGFAMAVKASAVATTYQATVDYKAVILYGQKDPSGN